MKDKRPEDWSAKERLEAVFEAEGLSELELGEFLRKKGLHSNHIVDWKREALSDAAEKNKRGRPKKDSELVEMAAKIKLLERDLHRKDRALAEQTALLILQKKAKAMWSKYEDDE